MSCRDRHSLSPSRHLERGIYLLDDPIPQVCSVDRKLAVEAESERSTRNNFEPALICSADRSDRNFDAKSRGVDLRLRFV